MSRPIGRVHPSGPSPLQSPFSSVWASLPEEITLFASDAAAALSSTASVPTKLWRISAAIVISDLPSFALRVCQRRFLPFIAACSSPWGFTVGLGAGVLLSNWENPQQCSVQTAHVAVADIDQQLRRLKENYNTWLEQGGKQIRSAASRGQTTRAFAGSYLRYMSLKLLRYAVAPVLLYYLPRAFPITRHAEELALIPRASCVIVAACFGLQSASDLVTELRLGSDGLLGVVFKMLQAQGAQGFEVKSTHVALRTAYNTFSVYGILVTLYHYANSGLRSMLLSRRPTTPVMQEFQRQTSRLKLAFIAIGAFTVFRAYQCSRA